GIGRFALLSSLSRESPGERNGFPSVLRRGFYSRDVPATTEMFFPRGRGGAPRRDVPPSMRVLAAAELQRHRQVGGLAEDAVEIGAGHVVHLLPHHRHRNANIP